MLLSFLIQNDTTILDIPAKNSIFNRSIMAALSLMCCRRHVFAVLALKGMCNSKGNALKVIYDSFTSMERYVHQQFLSRDLFPQ